MQIGTTQIVMAEFIAVALMADTTSRKIETAVSITNKNERLHQGVIKPHNNDQIGLSI